MWPTGVFGHVAPNSARFLTGRIGSEMVTSFCSLIGKLNIYNPGLYYGKLIIVINFEDAVHKRHLQDHTAIVSHSPAAQACACSPGQVRHLVTVADLYDSCDLFSRLRENHNVRHTFVKHETVTFVHDSICGVGQDSVRSKELGEIPD